MNTETENKLPQTRLSLNIYWAEEASAFAVDFQSLGDWKKDPGLVYISKTLSDMKDKFHEIVSIGHSIRATMMPTEIDKNTEIVEEIMNLSKEESVSKYGIDKCIEALETSLKVEKNPIKRLCAAEMISWFIKEDSAAQPN